MAHINRKNKDGCVNNLRDLFGSVLHIDVIRAVASQCDFDVQKSSNALLEMTNNSIGGQPLKRKDNFIKQKPKKSPSHSLHNSPAKKIEQSGLSRNTKSKKTLEVERVINNIREGYKILVILRGLPGSGKSRLAATITDLTLGSGDNRHHILSTDDYFNQNGRYLYDPKKISDAHEWNQRRAFQAMSRGLSPVIIDNTNIKMWEMKPYAMMATDYGYLIEILEPDTCWAFNDKELAKRNVHGVPKSTIKEKLEMYDKNVTAQKLLSAYNLCYKFQKPPQYRLFPPIVRNGFANFTLPSQFQHNHLVSTPPQIQSVSKSRSTPTISERHSNVQEAEIINLMDFTDSSDVFTKQHTVEPKCEDSANLVDEILMYSENSNTEVLQPRQLSDKKALLFTDIENAWGVDEKALQSWDIVTPIKSASPLPSFPLFEIDKNQTETADGWSNVEGSDFWHEGLDPPKGVTVLEARNRDINIDAPIKTTTIPKKIMIDQSCLTDDLLEGESDESRIKDLLDLFPKVSKSSLTELFIRCNKNFNWTVDLLLEDENLEVTSSVDQAEEITEVVDLSEEFMDDITPIRSGSPKIENNYKRKQKVEELSEDALELKKYIEGKFDINKEHYSDHVLKVKQYKFGGYQEQEPQPTTSGTAAISTITDSSSDDTSDCDNNDDNPKNMIELNLGESFVQQLETMFGTDSVFPKGYQPVVQMPRTLAQQIYSFYVESVCQQMEAQNHVLDRLTKEDEEFARKLQFQEDSLEPKTFQEDSVEPQTFQEIMDEQVALNIHKKSVDEWKNMTADNLAAKLTKQKLIKAFPMVDQNSLLEIWHAYDYDYKKTVEDLMVSVGSYQIQGSDESVKEPPLSTITLQEMKDAEEQCTFDEEFGGDKPATFYRDQANIHLHRREELYLKAQSYYQKGMNEVARFYSDLAKKETTSFDRANNIAATVFAEEHSKRLQKFDTIDLHYLYVKEAIPQLDIFLDRNINLLKGGNKKGQDLFVITGRGKNSIGGKSKIRPAVIARLSKRMIRFVQLNPGLLKIRVMRNSMMTSDLH